MHAQSGWDQEIDLAIAEYSIFFTFKNSWVAFPECFGSSSICTMKRSPINFPAFDWIWALYTSEFIRLLLSYVTSSLNTSDPVALEAMHAHAITLPHHVSQMMLYTLDHELFQAFSIPFFKIYLNFSHPKNAFPEVVWLFWQSLIWPCLHLVVNPLYLLWWSLLLIVDFDSDTSTSWRVLFSWLDVVKGFFFTMERNLRSSPHYFPLWTSRPFYVAELTGVFFFAQNVTNCWFGHSYCFCDLSDGFVSICLESICFTCKERSLNSNSFQMQMAHLESAPDLLSA